jgi:predicted metal-binding transcription factor (methanogenesis marker protein 9)
MDWYQIVIFVLGVILVIVGIVKTKQAAKVITETGELLTVIGQALEDGKVTREEITQIVKEAQDVKTAIQELINLIKNK